MSRAECETQRWHDAICRRRRKMESEDPMADIQAKNQTSNQDRERDRGIARRQDWPSRDIYSFSPFSVMRRLSEEMDRAFSTSFGLSRESGMWSPAVDVRERDGNLEICAELPGMSKDDV